MQLRQPTFTYSVCGIFPKNKKRIQFSFSKKGRFAEYFVKVWLTDLLRIRRTVSDKVLLDKAINIVKNSKYYR